MERHHNIDNNFCPYRVFPDSFQCGNRIRFNPNTLPSIGGCNLTGRVCDFPHSTGDCQRNNNQDLCDTPLVLGKDIYIE